MVLLQFSIGAVNDLHDAPRDAGKPGKPIASGELTALVAMAIAGLAAAVGVLLAAAVGVPVGLALIVLGIGYGYDLALKGTVLSWLPFAVGIPILPVYGWLVGGGTLPPAFVVILPVAFLAGAVLSIANADADAERDAAAGLDSLAIRLGPIVAPLVVLGGQCLVGGIAVASLLLGEGLGVGALTTPGGLFAVAGAALVPIAGAASVARGTRRVGAAARERAWRIEATGDALLAAAWLATAAGAGWFGG